MPKVRRSPSPLRVTPESLHGQAEKAPLIAHSVGRRLLTYVCHFKGLNVAATAIPPDKSLSTFHTFSYESGFADLLIVVRFEN